MKVSSATSKKESGNQRLAILLSMAMFVLVVDTSLMNVSISYVVRDLHTTVSGVQSAIALEALVSAAFILIGSKVGDLIGRKKAYIFGLLGYAVGALSMVLANSLSLIIVFWAIVGGLGASLMLPAMQSLIHGNFEGNAQRKAYALVGQDLILLQTTENRVNDLLNDKNRGAIGASLDNLSGMLSDSRPKVSASLANVQAATAQIVPILDNLKTTMTQANGVLSHLDSLVVENHEDIRTIVIELRETLATASVLTEQLKNTATSNSDNLDQTLENVRVTTENIRQLTDSLKNNPAVLIRGEHLKDRKPGDQD